MHSNTELDLRPMTTNMEEKIEGVRDMMLDRFSRVDQKLTAIEQLLSKMVETQSQIGSPLEKGNVNVTEKNMEEGGLESSKNQDKGNAVAIRGWRAEISRDDDDQETNDHIWGQRGWLHLGDQSRQGIPREAGSPYGWVGLYTHHYGKGGSQGTDFGRRKDFCGPAWMGQSESRFRQKDRPPFKGFHDGTVKGKFVNNFLEGWPITQRGRGLEGFGKKSENDTGKGWSSLGEKAVKTGQDENFKDSLKSDGWGRKESWVRSFGKVADITDAGGEEEEEEQTCSWASCEITKDGKTDASLQDSLEPEQCAKKDSGLWFKAIENETNGKWGSMESEKGREWSNIVEEKTDSESGWDASWGKKGHNKYQPQVASEGSNEKGHEESEKPGSWGWKEEGLGSKRKHSGSPVEGISSGSFTVTRQHLNIFTTEEQEILNEIEPIMQSTRRIMHQDRYNDDDPLSADDQTFILDNVFNHHPDKARKLGAGVDYIMVSKYKNFSGSRCFYVVSTDGRKEDFSYHKCLKNFVRAKYPDKADKFIPKYFKNSEPRRLRNRDHGSGPDEVGTPPWSASDRETRVVADEARTRSPAWQRRAGHLCSVGTKQKRACWRHKAAP